MSTTIEGIVLGPALALSWHVVATVTMAEYCRNDGLA